MKILFDTYIYKLQITGGINRYIAEIISGLPENFHPFLFKKIERKLCVPKHPHLKNFWMPIDTRFSPFFMQWKLKSMDIVHPSYYQIYSSLSWDKMPCKVVITVHDLIMMRFADRYEKSSKVISAQKAAIKRADHIICISHSTRNDLLEKFPECEERSSVIHLASSLPQPDGSFSNPFDKRYFLFVGARSFYKNFELTARAFALLYQKYSDLQLVVVGGSFNEEENKLIHGLGISDGVKLVKHPDDSELALLYKYSEALIYPSEYEGFGLPPLEAMKMGVPVIALNISSLPEVIGAGGILIDPEKASPYLLAEAAESLLTSESLCKRLSAAALQQESQFSWKKTVDKTVDVYNELQ
ncbi:MAG: glycosyltransferase family 4 protein [Chthoniobacterales bacterium]